MLVTTKDKQFGDTFQKQEWTSISLSIDKDFNVTI